MPTNESSKIDQKYRELQEYRAKLAQEGKVVMQTYDPKKSEDVKNERLAGADLATKQGSFLTVRSYALESSSKSSWVFR